MPRKKRAHGEGNLYQLTDGIWRAYVYDERKRRRYVRGETRAEALRNRDELRGEIKRGIHARDRKTVGWLFDEYLEAVRASERRPWT
jgi:hypothetical protein